MTIDELKDEIYRIEDVNDLRNLNDAAVDRMHELRKRKDKILSQEYQVGQEIKFVGRGNTTLTGVIEKLNPSTLRVRDNTTKIRWKIYYEHVIGK